MFGDYRDPWTETDQLSVSGLRSVAEQAASANAHYLANQGFMVGGGVGSVAGVSPIKWGIGKAVRRDADTLFGNTHGGIYGGGGGYLGRGTVEIYRVGTQDFTTQLNTYTDCLIPTGILIPTVNPIAEFIPPDSTVEFALDEMSGVYVVRQILRRDYLGVWPVIPHSSLTMSFGDALDEWGDVQLDRIDDVPNAAFEGVAPITYRFPHAGAFVEPFPSPGDTIDTIETVEVQIRIVLEASLQTQVIFVVNGGDTFYAMGYAATMTAYRADTGAYYCPLGTCPATIGTSGAGRKYLTFQNWTPAVPVSPDYPSNQEYSARIDDVD